MKIFKNLCLFVLALCACVTFCACGRSSSSYDNGGDNGNETIEQSAELTSIVGVYQPDTLEDEHKAIRDNIYSEVADIIASALDKVYNLSKNDATAVKFTTQRIDGGLQNESGELVMHAVKQYYVFNAYESQEKFAHNKVKEAVYNYLIDNGEKKHNQIFQQKLGLFDKEIDNLFSFIAEGIIGKRELSSDNIIREEILSKTSFSENDLLKKPIRVAVRPEELEVNKNANQFIVENGLLVYNPNSGIPTGSDKVKIRVSETYYFIDSNFNFNKNTWNPSSDYIDADNGKYGITNVSKFKNYKSVLNNIRAKVEDYLKNETNIPNGTTDASSNGLLTAPIVEAQVFHVGYYEIDAFSDLGAETSNLPKVKVYYLYDDNGYSTKDYGTDSTNKFVLPERNWLTLYFTVASDTQQNFWFTGFDAVVSNNTNNLSDDIKNYEVAVTANTQIGGFDYNNTPYKANITDYKSTSIDNLNDYGNQYQIDIDALNKNAESNRAPKLGLTRLDAVMNSQGYKSQIKFASDLNNLGKLVSRADGLSNTIAINFNTTSTRHSFAIEQIDFKFMYINPDTIDFNVQE